jgi:hypothetical protein
LFIFVFQMKRMKQYQFSILFLLLSFLGNAQNSQLWKGYFSYNQISDLAESNRKVFASAENAIFSKDIQTNEIKTYNTIDGLSGLTISAIYHSDIVNRTFVGYDNGLIKVINQTDGSVATVVGIRDQEGGIPPNKKRINHFYEYNNKLYISCDFGIVEYKLDTFLFGETFIIGAGGSQVDVLQTTVVDSYIYAITRNNGIKRAVVTATNLIHYNAWLQFDSGFWLSAVNFNGQLVALNANNRIYRHNGTFFLEIYNLIQPAKDLRSRGDYLIACSQNSAVVINMTFGLVTQINANSIPNVTTTPVFSCATILNDRIFIGTTEQGVFETSIANPMGVEQLLPDGPSRNKVFSMATTKTNDFWVVYGDYSAFNNPYPLDSYGLSKYTSNGWINIPYEEVLGAKSISSITVNPSNENQVFASSYFSGLLKIENNEVIQLFDKTNSSLEDAPSNPGVGYRIGHSAYDKNGNLWMTNGLLVNLLKVLRANGQWGSYSFEPILTQSTATGRIAVDKNNTKWICTLDQGLIAFNENYNNRFKKLTDGEDRGNLPVKAVQTVAIDNRNQLWIGTKKGLRVLPSVDRFLTDDGQLKANAIIFMEDGLAQELMYEQFITDIVVDGANNKWVGTADAGVFCFSSNGQETLYHFTIENSPLPSNIIKDIDINGNTGEVFFVTEQGLVSFKGTSTKSSQDLSQVYVYPNPVRPNFEGTVKISGLVDKANVKITDIEGSLVHEAIAEGGTIEWDTTAFGKYKVASGVYMIFIATQDAMDTNVKKVMIIR